MIGSTIRNTANPTMLQAGYKANVIPSTAEATIDTRFLPGHEDELLATIDELIGEGVDREFVVRDIAVETSLRRRRRRRDAGRLAARGSRRAARSLPDERRHRREVVLDTRHSVLRVLAAAAATRPRLHLAVPRHRRAGPGRCVCSSACACSTGSCPC